MKLPAATLAALAVTAAVAGATTVLEPGDGRQYLRNWCGGQQMNEFARGFDHAGKGTAAIRVTATCSTGGRGTKPRTYFACWLVTFADTGAIVHRKFVNSGSWRQGQPQVACALALDADAVFDRADGAKLVTSLVGRTYRAVLKVP